MEKRVETIQKCISNISDVEVLTPFILDDLSFIIKGKVSVKLTDENLEFDIVIYPHYPLKRHDSDTIKFFNENLIEYGHVMKDGSICVHTPHSPILEKKLQYEFNSLKTWIAKYYLSKEKDRQYEHLIISHKLVGGTHNKFLFTDVNYKFSKCEYGFVEYSEIGKGSYGKNHINSYIIQKFISEKSKRIILCKWNNTYKSLPALRARGLFVFIESPPALHNKFILTNWQDLEPYVSQEFLKFLNSFERKPSKRKKRGNKIPLFFGYNIPDGIHWQAALIEVGNFPNYAQKEKGLFVGYFDDKEIDWMMTENCSYKYFFGRGTLTDKLTKGKILIIGVGAIGSILATTLARGGCTQIEITDFDIKEPGNVCRSEYSFAGGITNKVDELFAKLISISPFIEVFFREQEFFEFSKALQDNKNFEETLKQIFNRYDIIFDCSTDNDLMYMLNQLKLTNLVTMSITNHAKELVCATEPNAYSWVLHQFENVLENDTEDLHNPTGCWSPTFKASYNDINVLVQYALKHINTKILQNAPIKNFVLKTDTKHGFNIKLKEF